MAGALTKRGKFEHRHVYRENAMRRLDLGCHKPWNYQNLGESLEPPEAAWLYHTPISDF